MPSAQRLIPLRVGHLEADVAEAPAMVIFAHGSGSSRRSPRNRQVALALRAEGIGTVLVDLLTPGEITRDATTEQYRYDVPLLADRVSQVVAWAHSMAGGSPPRIGLYGASTGAAAAVIAAARMPQHVAAVVSRGGRLDLAAGALPRLQAPLRMIVGDADPAVLAINRSAVRQLSCPHDLAVVPGAGHLFGEPGAMDRVVDLTCDWFTRHLSLQERGPGGSSEFDVAPVAALSPDHTRRLP